MKLEIIKCTRGVFQRLKESRVFQFKLKCNSQPTLQVTLTRWATLLLYGWLAALVVYLFLPLIILIRPSNLLSLNEHLGWYWALLLTHVLIAVMVVLYLQAKLYIRLPRRTFKCGYCFDIQSFLRYPSLHAAVISGVVFLFWLSGSGLNGSHANNSNLFIVAIEKVTLLFRQDSSDRYSDPALSAFGLFSFFIVYGFFSVLRNEMTLRKENEKTNGSGQKTSLDLLTCSDDEFEEWICTEKDELKLDFFKRKPYIDRIKERIDPRPKDKSNSELKKKKLANKGQVLLGEFGSGKTTIVDLVEEQLDQLWIKSRFDCWQRSGKAAELANQFMEQVIYDVGQQIDASSITRLPDSFSHALYGVSHWLSFLDPLLRPDTPENVVMKLDRLLEANNRKLLIVVENVDRNKERDQFIDVISAILDKLSSNQNIRFIFSADENFLDAQIVYRISDYKERVETFVPPEVILRFMALCLKKSLNSNPNNNANGELLIIPYLKQGFTLPIDGEEQIQVVAKFFKLAPNSNDPMNGDSMEYQVLDALADVLSNPRRLKYVLRHCYHLWTTKLAGEVNLFDLIIYATASEDGELRETIKNYPQEILEGNGDSPYSSRLRDAMNKQSENDQKSAPQSKQFVVNIIDHDNFVGNINKKSDNASALSASSITLDLHNSSGERTKRSTGGHAREKIAFYLLNGHFYGGQRARNLLCQPIIDKNGIAEESFRKYRKITDIGQVEGYANSDQEFLRNYIDASSKIYDEKATKAVLDLSLDSPDIFQNLIDTMTHRYFESEKQVIRFLGNAILTCDQKYVTGFNNLCFFDIVNICVKASDGQDEKIDELIKIMQKSFFSAYDSKEYQWVVRVLWRMTTNFKSDLFNRVFDPVFRSLLTVEVTVKFAEEYLSGRKNCEHLPDHFLMLLESMYSKPPHDSVHFYKDTIVQSSHVFLTFLVKVFDKNPDVGSIIKKNLSHSNNRFETFKDNLSGYIDLENMTEKEVEVFNSLYQGSE